MKNKLSKIIIACMLVSMMCVSGVEAAAGKPKYLKSIDILSGYGLAKLHVLGSYRLFPLAVALNYDLNPFLKEKKINLPGLFEFQIEPFAGISPDPRSTNVELGNTFGVKLGILPETSKFQPYVKAGVGGVYMSLHTREQGTQFNFIEQGGVGAHYSLTHNTAFTAECRYRHLSNAAMNKPNHGINSLFFLAGITRTF